MAWDIKPYGDYDKEIIIYGPVAIKVDFDDVDPEEAKRIAGLISRLPELVKADNEIQVDAPFSDPEDYRYV